MLFRSETGNNIAVNINKPITQLKDVSGTMLQIPIIESQLVSIPKTKILEQQQHQSDNLNQYNEILTLLENKSTQGIKEKIIAYLENNNHLGLEYNAPSDAYADLIIVDLPRIITSA